MPVWEGGKWRLHSSASKGAVLVLTRALAREAGEDNICVNSVSPGFTLSETQVATSSNAHMPRRQNRPHGSLGANTPIRRLSPTANSLLRLHNYGVRQDGSANNGL